MAKQNSRIGKAYTRDRQNRPSNIILPKSQSLSVQSIKTWREALQLASLPENPNRAPLMDLYKSISRDLHLKSDIQTRVLKIMGSKFKITDKNGVENTDMHNLLSSKWFNRFLYHAMKAKFWGSSVIELWDIDQDTLELKAVNYIPSENILFTKGLITKEVGDEVGYPYKEGIFKPYYIQIGTNNDLGILEDIAPDALAKKFAKAAWTEYCEKFGIPPRWVTTDSFNTTRHQELAEMMANMVNNHWAVLQGNEKIEMMQTNGGTAKAVFDDLISRMNSEISKGILGQDGTTNSNEKSGNYGSLKIMQDVSDDRHNADKTDIAYLVNDELLWRLEEISPVYKGISNYRFDWDESKELTPDELIETVVKLSNAGYSVDIDYLTENTGIPISEFKQAFGMQPQPTPQTGDGKKKLNSRASLNAFIFNEVKEFYAKDEQESIEAVDISSYKKLIDKIAKNLHQGKINDSDFNNDLVKQIYSDLNKSTAEGYGKTYTDYTRDPGRKFELEQNVFKFSAAKTYQEQAQLNQMLYDENGNKISYAEFKSKANELNLEFNQNYLRTEVNTFQRTASQAEKWSKYEGQRNLYPNLQYKTAKDKRVRDDHDAVDDIIKPIDDPFWDKWYPPNGWNCRCYVVQTSKPATRMTPKGNPTMGFENNVGKTVKPMGDDHPYFIFPENEESKIRNEMEELKLKNPIYKEIYRKGKAKVEGSIWANQNKLESNIEAAKKIAEDLKTNVKLIPEAKTSKASKAELEISKAKGDHVSIPNNNVKSNINKAFEEKLGGKGKIRDEKKAFISMRFDWQINTTAATAIAQQIGNKFKIYKNLDFVIVTTNKGSAKIKRSDKDVLNKIEKLR